MGYSGVEETSKEIEAAIEAEQQRALR